MTGADLRLVPPAVAAWLAGLAVVAAPAAVARAAGAAVALLGGAVVLVVVAAVRTVRRPSTDHARAPVDDAVTPARASPATARAHGTAPQGHGTAPQGSATEPQARATAPQVTAGTSTRGAPRAARRALPSLVLSVVAAATVLVAGAAAHEARTPDVLVAAAASGRPAEVTGRAATTPVPYGEAVRWTVVTDAVRVDGTWWRVRVPIDVVTTSAVPLDGAVRVRGTLRLPTRDAGPALRLQGDEPHVTAPPRRLPAWTQQVRAAAHEVASTLPPDVRGLLPAVTVGDTTAVPDDLVTAMRTSGLAHVMAVSGAHFAILGSLVLTATAALRAPRVVRGAAVAVVGTALLLVVGPEPSVVRAAVMGAVGLVALLAGRRAAGPAALATAVVVLLVTDPWLAVDVGFALSVAATAGIVVLGAPLVAAWSPRCGRTAATLLAAPVAAQLGCLPVTLAVWPTFAPWAVVANVVVAPAVAPATVLGLGATALLDVWPAAADVLALAAGAAVWWVAVVARATAALPGAALPWWPGAGGAAAAVLVLVGASALVLRHGR